MIDAIRFELLCINRNADAKAIRWYQTAGRFIE
jgi:hypothetical protein